MHHNEKRHIALSRAVAWMVAVVASLTFTPAKAQTAAGKCETYVSNDTVRYTLTHFGVNGDFTPWHVTKIVQDGTGMMWFGAWNGLFRFDGQKFTQFKPRAEDGLGIFSDRIRNLSLRGKRADSDTVQTLALLIETQVAHFHIPTCSFRPAPEGDTVFVPRSFYSESDIVAKYGGERPLSQGKPDVVVDNDTITEVGATFTDRQGNRWVSAESGLYRVSAHHVLCRAIEGAGHSMTKSIFQDKASRIWIATKQDEVLGIYDKELNLLGYLGADGELHSRPVKFCPVYTIFQDSRGLIWLGSKPQGLYRLREKESGGSFHMEYFTKRPNAMGLSHSSIYDIEEDSIGRLWLATFGGGVNVIPDPSASQNMVRFVSMHHGFSKYPTNVLRTRNLQLLPGGTMAIASTKGLLVASDIYASDMSEIQWTLHTTDGGLSTITTMDITELPGGKIAVSSESGGLNVADMGRLRETSDVFDDISVKKGLQNDVVMSTLTVGDSLLIVCHNNSMTTLRISEDGRLQPKQTFTPLYWGREMLFSEARPQLLDDGRLILGLEDGTVTVKLSDIESTPDDVRIALTSCRIINGESENDIDWSVDSRDTISLCSCERSITLTFTTLDYRDGIHPNYRVRLDDGKWTALNNGGRIALYNLSAGAHRLEIAGTDNLGQWISKKRELTIICAPKFHETWYGILIIALLSIGTVFAIIYTIFRIRNLERIRQETREAYLALLDEQQRREQQRAMTQQNASAAAQSAIPSAATLPEETSVGGANGTQDANTEPTVTVVAPRLSSDDEAFMRRFTDFVQKHLSDNTVDVQEMADATAVSRSSLNRRVRGLLGTTPADFLRDARIKRACMLLTETSDGISEIAFACGFSDAKYFGRVFRGVMGVSPSEFRAQTQKR